MTKTKEMRLSDISRSSTITRWHGVNCHRYPSVAEHSFLVTMYASKLANVICLDLSDSDRLALLNYCLWHDLPEVMVGGDIPTPLKRMIESKFPEGSSPIDQIEDEYCPQHKEFKDAIHGSPLARIAKLADIMEAAKFISVEGKGYDAIGIKDERIKAFTRLIDESKLLYPELNWDSAYKELTAILTEKAFPINFVDSFKD